VAPAARYDGRHDEFCGGGAILGLILVPRGSIGVGTSNPSYLSVASSWSNQCYALTCTAAGESRCDNSDAFGVVSRRMHHFLQLQLLCSGDSMGKLDLGFSDWTLATFLV
jgi:hypothetical protein